MRHTRRAHQVAGVGVAHLDLARLRRRVDPGDEAHGAAGARGAFEGEQHGAGQGRVTRETGRHHRYPFRFEDVLVQGGAQGLEQEIAGG